MSTPESTTGANIWDLPPLILHPFQEQVSPSALLDNSKASLMLCGLMPSDGSDPEDLRRRLLAGRYSEIRMLFFLGKDVFRWIDQCVEWAARIAELSELALPGQSFARLLASHAPVEVREKLTRWGVADYSAIFTRGIGMNLLFVEPPLFDILSEEFLRNYYRYLDAVYRSYLESQPHTAITEASFRFSLYASGEYSKMLETEWGAN
jgi:hypothetical protein